MSHTMQSGLRIQSLKTQFAFIALLLVSTPVLADGRPQRFSLGLGLASTSGLPQEGVQVNFVLSGEYEYPVNQFFGLGLASSYIFSNPGLLLIAAPVVSVHPFGTGLLVNAAPLFQFGSSTGF